MKRYVAPRAIPLSTALDRMGEPTESMSEGRVFVGGERAEDDRELATGAVVLVWEARSEKPLPSGVGGADRVRRLFETSDFTIVEKPPALPTEPDHRGLRSLLHETAAELDVPVSTLHAHTRLDVGVSGVVLISKTKAGHAHVASLAKEHAIGKRYVAIVSGNTKDEAVIDVPIAKGNASRHAFTSFVTLGRTTSANTSFSLVLLTPETGRLHQIRIHLSSIGTPIVGDRKHGGKTTLVRSSGSVVSLDRILLHAYALILPGADPVVAAVPPIFLESWRDLDGSPEAWNNLEVA